MSNLSPRIHELVAFYDFGGFSGPAGPAAFIAPLADDEDSEGWIVVDDHDKADLSSLAAVIGIADLVIIARDLVGELIQPASDLAGRGFGVVILDLPEEQPIPAAIADAITPQREKQK